PVGGELFTKFLPPDTKIFDGGELNRSVSPLMQSSGGVGGSLHVPVISSGILGAVQPSPFLYTGLL
ncbi:hypothetical protein, partial [Pseudomonas aeruginosa]|uniref:hypothetical protein n=1 Tax=Pseudomonas aeruginosa TaxID=287 RepID=UPI001F4AD6F3